MVDYAKNSSYSVPQKVRSRQASPVVLRSSRKNEDRPFESSSFSVNNTELQPKSAMRKPPSCNTSPINKIKQSPVKKILRDNYHNSSKVATNTSYQQNTSSKNNLHSLVELNTSNVLNGSFASLGGESSALRNLNIPYSNFQKKNSGQINANLIEPQMYDGIIETLKQKTDSVTNLKSYSREKYPSISSIVLNNKVEYNINETSLIHLKLERLNDDSCHKMNDSCQSYEKVLKKIRKGSEHSCIQEENSI